MTNKEILNNMLNNLNENGLNILVDLFGDLDSRERYNKNTTPERIEELAQLEQLEQQRDDNIKEERAKEREAVQTKEESDRQEIITTHNKLINLVSTIKPGNYFITTMEMQALYASNNGDTWGFACDNFKIGFLKGQRAERARRKKVSA